MIPELPQYKHDCSACLFLGRYKNYDLYAHVHEHLTELIARYSNDGPDYSAEDVGIISTNGRHSEALIAAESRYNKLKLKSHENNKDITNQQQRSNSGSGCN